MKEPDTFGIYFIGDGMTTKQTIFINNIGSMSNIEVVVTKILDCYNKMDDGGKTDTT